MPIRVRPMSMGHGRRGVADGSVTARSPAAWRSLAVCSHHIKAFTLNCKCCNISVVTEFLTVGEAAKAFGLTPRQLRYLDMGAVTSADGSRLYDASGLVLVSLFAQVSRRFRAWGFPAWKARAGLLYCEPEIRAALARRGSAVLVLDAWRGVVRVESSAPSDCETIALRPVLSAMRVLIAETRDAQPEVWTGREFTEEPELLSV